MLVNLPYSVVPSCDNFTPLSSNETVSPGWDLPSCTSFVNYMQEKLQWRKQNSAEKFSHIAALHHVSQNLTFSKHYPVVEHTTLKFNHILKRRTKDKVDMFELEYSVLDYRLRSWLEFDVVYAKLDAQFVQHLLPSEVQEFCKREKQFTRKKKENIPIYERYPVTKTSPDQIKSKPAVRPKTAGKKARSGEKMDNLSDSLSSLKITGSVPLRDITASISSSTISGTSSSESDYKRTDKRADKRTDKRADTIASDLSSSEDEYIPLSQRLALRRAKSAKSSSSPDTAVGSTSSLSSLDSKQASEISNNNIRDEQSDIDQIETETEIDNIVAETVGVTTQLEDNTLSGSEADGYIDSDVQLLPHNFMDEYLDLSRDEILGISREDTVSQDIEEGYDGSVMAVGMRPDNLLTDEVDDGTDLEVSQNENGLSLNLDLDDKSISRENSFLATESVDSEDYKQLIDGGDYHKLFFATPRKRDGGFVKVSGVNGVEESASPAPDLQIPTMKLSQVTSQADSDFEAGGDSYEASLKDRDYDRSDEINIASDSSESSAEASMNSVSEPSYEVQQTQSINPEHEGEVRAVRSDGRDTTETRCRDDSSPSITTETRCRDDRVTTETRCRDDSSPSISEQEHTDDAVQLGQTKGNTNLKNVKFDNQENLDLSAELDSKLQDISDLSGGFSPKTPAQQQNMISSFSDLSISELPSFTPDHLTLSPTRPCPLPDISSELVDSVIRESVKEISATEVSNNEISVDDTSKNEISVDDISNNEISNNELSYDDSLLFDSLNFSPTQLYPEILVPDTPAPLDKLSSVVSRDITRDITRGAIPDIAHQDTTQELSLSAGGAVLGPITSNKPSLPQQLSFDIGNISEFSDLSSSFTAGDDKSGMLPSPDLHKRDVLSQPGLPSPDLHKRDVLSQPGLPSPDAIKPGMLSQPHLPPDTSFLEPQIQISTPVWHRKPLSEIKMTSTPKGFTGTGNVIDVSRGAGSDLLPEIQPERFEQPDFNLNITELLETNDYT